MKGLRALADQARWIAAVILLVAFVCDLLAVAYDQGWDDGWDADDPEPPTTAESESTE
ncbi:MAG: hypothetical protein ABSB34_00940 [Candidatus Limnocylindrales bacterium]|jgi:hypothetical protein